MKIGIITFQRALNFGAVLQMYALYAYLKSEGHEPFVIDFIPEQKPNNTSLKDRIWHTLKDPARIFRALQKRIIAKKNVQTLGNRFELFRNKHIIFSESPQTLGQLKNDPPEADLYICGSDQIWNPGDEGFNPGYFLDFGASKTKRISYGASFGRSEIPSQFVVDLKMLLKGFDAISVREASGVKTLKRIVDTDVTRVVDPTFLVDNYSEVIDESVVPKERYLLVYRLNQEDRLAKFLNDTALKIGQERDLQIYAITPKSKIKTPKRFKKMSPSPAEFLGLIKNAELILTNSFHGAVFSILFKKSFMVFARDIYTDRQNLRMTELLGRLGLSHHFVSFGTCDEDLSEAQVPIAFEVIDKKLDAMRTDSYEYLNKLLG